MSGVLSPKLVYLVGSIGARRFESGFRVARPKWRPFLRQQFILMLPILGFLFASKIFPHFLGTVVSAKSRMSNLPFSNQGVPSVVTAWAPVLQPVLKLVHPKP